MNTSTIEEIITALWTIAALLAFNGGFQIIGWALTVKAVSDLLCVIFYGWKEVKAKHAAKAAK